MRISKIKYFFSFGMWRMQPGDHSTPLRVAADLLRKVYLSLRFFIGRGHTDYTPSLSFSTLLAIAATETFDFDAHELLPLDDTDDDNADIYPIPERYTRIFAELSAADIARCAAAWAGSEELDCDAADLLPIIENLCALARRIENGQQLYFITA